MGCMLWRGVGWGFVYKGGSILMPLTIKGHKATFICLGNNHGVKRGWRVGIWTDAKHLRFRVMRTYRKISIVQVHWHDVGAIQDLYYYTGHEKPVRGWREWLSCLRTTLGMQGSGEYWNTDLGCIDVKVPHRWLAWLGIFWNSESCALLSRTALVAGSKSKTGTPGEWTVLTTPDA